MSYGYFSKYDREVVRVFQIREHHAQIVKLGRYEEPILSQYYDIMFRNVTESVIEIITNREMKYANYLDGLEHVLFNPSAHRKTKIAYTFGLSECNRVNGKNLSQFDKKIVT